MNLLAHCTSGGASLSRVDEKMVELSNGCICCTLREDLLLEVIKCAKEGRFDYLIIESTGISEPMHVAETFTFQDKEGNSLSDFATYVSFELACFASHFLSLVSAHQPVAMLLMFVFASYSHYRIRFAL